MITIKPEMHNFMSYNGSEDKCGVTIEGINYVLKRRKKDWANVYCEYVASNVINALGGCAHNTKLAVENGEVVVLCEDFTSVHGPLRTLKMVSESSIETDRDNHDYYFDDVMYVLDNLRDCDTEEVKRKFIEMYVFDSLLGNPDRHQGNWGICAKGSHKHFSPIFDNGACLLPRASIKDLTLDWLRDRIKVWPNSKIMFGSRERSSYYNIWRTDLLPLYARTFADKLCIKDAIDCIYNLDGLNSDQRWFYSAVVFNRYKVILKQEDI